MCLGRLAVTAVEHLEPKLQAELRSVLDSLPVETVDLNTVPSALIKGSKMLASMLDEILQDQTENFVSPVCDLTIFGFLLLLKY